MGIASFDLTRDSAVKPHKTAQKNKKKIVGARAEADGLAVVSLSGLVEACDRYAAIPEDSCPFFAADEDALLWCVDLLASSPSALAHLLSAAREGWSVAFADLGGGGFSLESRDRIVLLDRHGMDSSALSRSAFFRTAALLSLARALRDLWQEERMRGAERVYAPESFLILSRLRAADADTFALLCAWELRQAGHGAIWRHAIGSPEGDMALAFTRRIEREGAAGLFSAPALAAAFVQWFGEEDRMKSADHESLEFLDDVLHAAGRGNPFGRGRLGAELVETLSQLPDGTRYLAGRGGEIVSDPTFYDIGDEINQAHLFHIARDLEVTRIGNVPFRDAGLARKIFPELSGR